MPQPIDLTPVKKAKKLKTSVAIPADLVPRAREVAQQHRVSVSDYLTRLLAADLAARGTSTKAA